MRTAGRLHARASASVGTRHLSTVMANSIHIHFVDERGNRKTVPARVGMNLLECADMHNVGLNGSCQGWGPREMERTEAWTELTWGSGPHCFQCHVQIDERFASVLPKKSAKDVDEFRIAWEEEYVPTSSHLACSVMLGKEHDGMVVLVPDPPPVDLL